jgi:hypothetical protein
MAVEKCRLDGRPYLPPGQYCSVLEFTAPEACNLTVATPTASPGLCNNSVLDDDNHRTEIQFTNPHHHRQGRAQGRALPYAPHPITAPRPCYCAHIRRGAAVFCSHFRRRRRTCSGPSTRSSCSKQRWLTTRSCLQVRITDPSCVLQRGCRGLLVACRRDHIHSARGLGFQAAGGEGSYLAGCAALRCIGVNCLWRWCQTACV